MHIYIILGVLLSEDLKYQYQYFAQPATFKEADQLAIYEARPSVWTQDYWETSFASGRAKALNLGPLDYNTSVQNHSAMLYKLYGYFKCIRLMIKFYCL